MRVVQISDLHLWTHDEDARTIRYLENAAEHPNRADNLGSLHAVLDDVQAQCTDGFDRLVVTGDIAQDEQQETYELLRQVLDERGLLDHTLCLPGNHEQRAFLRQVFPEGTVKGHGGFSEEVCGWRLLGVDTHDTDAKAGWDGNMDHLHEWDGGTGLLKPAQLQWLEQELKQHATQPTVVFIHHPPMKVGSPWLDHILIEQPGQSGIERVFARAPQIRAVYCGKHFIVCL